MKKKVWDITVKDNPNRVVMGENDEFYTTDTEAYLVFNLQDKDFQPQSAMLTLENRNDGSLKSEEVSVVGDNIAWEMPERYIEHSGNWQAQLVYEQMKGGVPEKYTSGVMAFTVNSHIKDKKKPSLVEIENWEKFIRDGTELIETWENLEALREENERQRQENYQELLDTGVLQTNINTKLEQLEEEYAPKLTEVTSQLAQTVKHGQNESVTKAMLSQEIKEDINNGEIEFVLNTSEVENGAITNNKLNLPYNLLPETVIISAGNLERTLDGFRSSEWNRAGTEGYVHLVEGDVIRVLNTETIDWMYYTFDVSDGSYAGGTLWLSDSEFIVTSENYYRFAFRFKDNRATEDYLDFLGNSLYIIKENNAISTKNADSRYVKKVETETGLTSYVTLNGSDNNTGEDENNGFATLQKAFDVGSTVVYVERGIYYERPILNNVDKIEIRAIEDDNWDKNRQLAEFRGSDKLDEWVLFNGIYRQPYDGNLFFRWVFIDKSQDPIQNENRPIYRANIWEVIDGIEDYNMKPVLTLEECETEQGTFFYDGEFVYVNPIDINNEFHAPIYENGLDLRDNKKVVLRDIQFSFASKDALLLNNIEEIDAENVVGSHSSRTDGFSIDYTNGKFVRCKAIKNANDGFNLHFRGKTTFIDCDGLYNFDDGISHHEGCEGTIIGGNWKGNRTGAGIAPADGAKVNWYNCLIEDNLYGVYHPHASTGIEGIEAISSGNLYKNNDTVFYNSGAIINSYNDTYVDNGSPKEVAGVNIY